MLSSKHVHLEDWMMDPATESYILPACFRSEDNSRRLSFCKKAVRKAMDSRLTPDQNRRIRQHFFQGLSKSEIARREGTSCSAVGKSLRVAENTIREYAEMYMDIYDDVEKELLNALW